MNTYIFIGIGLGILLFLIFKRSIFRKENYHDVKKFTDSNALLNNEKIKVIVNELIKRGKKIEAIRFLKISENLSLSEAKDFVEKIELMNGSGSKDLSKDIIGKYENAYEEPESNINSLLNEKIKALLLSGNKIAAIKLVVDEQKTGLKEAKIYVDEIESNTKNGKI